MLSMEDMDTVLAMLDMPDMERTDTHMPTTERDPLMLNQRLMLMLTMDTMDMPDLMPMDMVLDTEPMDTHTTERDSLMLSQRLMLTLDTTDTDMPDLMPMVLDTEDTTMDKSYTLGKNSTKQKLKANNIQL